MLEILNKLMALVVTVAAVWVVLSYFEIVVKNTHENPQYSPINAIILMTDKR